MISLSYGKDGSGVGYGHKRSECLCTPITNTMMFHKQQRQTAGRQYIGDATAATSFSLLSAIGVASVLVLISDSEKVGKRTPQTCRCTLCKTEEQVSS